MKNALLLFSFLFLMTGIKAQKLSEKEVPPLVLESFSKSHADASELNWTKEGTNFQATYMAQNTAMASLYADSGQLIEYRTDVPMTSLPAEALEFIKLNFTDKDAKEIQQVHDYAGTVTYRVKVRGQVYEFNAMGYTIKSPTR